MVRRSPFENVARRTSNGSPHRRSVSNKTPQLLLRAIELRLQRAKHETFESNDFSREPTNVGVQREIGVAVDDLSFPYFIPVMIFIIPITAIFGAFVYLIVRTLSRSRVRELEIRERIAMIERGLVPAPEVDCQRSPETA